MNVLVVWKYAAPPRKHLPTGPDPREVLQDADTCVAITVGLGDFFIAGLKQPVKEARMDSLMTHFWPGLSEMSLIATS
jgi:hypothetical protein